MNIPLSNPDISDFDRQAVLDVLNTPALSLGPRLPEFEKVFARTLGSRHAVAVNSGTSALHLCVKAAEIGEGDEVITTPFSFVASANCALFERAWPVFVDIEEETYNINPFGIEDAITSRTRAILPVHVFGRPCEMDPILLLARHYGLYVIEDACEAIGATYGGKQVGTFGHTAAFAFYPNKQITTGEGGMIVTDESAVAALCRSWRNQGRSETGAWLQHERLGYNYRLSDINCALGLAQLKQLDEILAMRNAVAGKYTSLLKDRVPEVIPPAPAARHSRNSWFVYVVRLREEFTRSDRDAVLEHLRAEGIGCNNYFSPIHLQPFYQEMFGYRKGCFPITERVADRTIALPFFNRLGDAQIEVVCNALAQAVSRLRHAVFSLSQASVS